MNRETHVVLLDIIHIIYAIFENEGISTFFSPSGAVDQGLASK